VHTTLFFDYVNPVLTENILRGKYACVRIVHDCQGYVMKKANPGTTNQ